MSWATSFSAKHPWRDCEEVEILINQIQIRNIEKDAVFLVEFFLHRIGNLIETAAALLVTSVSKIASGHKANVRTCYSQALQKSFSRCRFNLVLI